MEGTLNLDLMNEQNDRQFDCSFKNTKPWYTNGLIRISPDTLLSHPQTVR